MLTSIVGYPRVGSLRELKFATEQYFRGEISEAQLQETAQQIRQTQWLTQQNSGLDLIPANDFSFYDNVLDMAMLLNIIPQRYRDLHLSPLDTYFAAARGYQGQAGDVKALAMKKWFNTNYHYLVPEFEDTTQICLATTKPFDEFQEAKALGITAKPMLIGPFTLLKLARYTGEKTATDFVDQIVSAYSQILTKFAELGAIWVQFDEPYLVFDLTDSDIQLLERLYGQILQNKGTVKVLLQTYFGDVRDCYQNLLALDFDGIGLDFLEGKQSEKLVKENGFTSDKILFVGIVNGKNIWRNDYAKSLSLLDKLTGQGIEVALSTSCSLLHVPYTLSDEDGLPSNYKQYFAFATEKLGELRELSELFALHKTVRETSDVYQANQELFAHPRPDSTNPAVKERVANINVDSFTRLPAFDEREQIQKQRFALPLFPTTTIGSYPQTPEVKANRASFKKGEISEAQYEEFNRQKIADCVHKQEEIGLDVIVHGEFERNDMVEYFGEQLAGYLFTKQAWVQSYGTRCVKPPIIWGDVSRPASMTVRWSVYAQSLTDRPVKGMLTGPVTILNWSFPREDISVQESTYQIALAIRDEVLDLEANGIKIIQVDEAALREKLPLRQSDWFSEYLDWAIPAFRLVHSGVRPETQIHTHMCYSEFTDIVRAIDDMDADVITFEASRSDLLILDSLREANFQTEVGPGVYDIHSPRVPSTTEIVRTLQKMLGAIPADKLWVNPDCGLKTRGESETWASLQNLVAAAKELRNENC